MATKRKLSTRLGGRSPKKQKTAQSSNSSDSASSTSSTDTEGSLADFVVHDSSSDSSSEEDNYSDVDSSDDSISGSIRTKSSDDSESSFVSETPTSLAGSFVDDFPSESETTETSDLPTNNSQSESFVHSGDPAGSHTSSKSTTSTDSSLEIVGHNRSLLPEDDPASAIFIINLDGFYGGLGEVPPDGNCGYRALGEGLKEQSGILDGTATRPVRSSRVPQLVRNELVDWFLEHKDWYMDPAFIQHRLDSDTTAAKIVTRIKGPGHPFDRSHWFADPFDCQLFADRFQCIVLLLRMPNSAAFVLFHPSTRTDTRTVDSYLNDLTTPVVCASFKNGHASRVKINGVDTQGFRDYLKEGRYATTDGNGTIESFPFVRVFHWSDGGLQTTGDEE
ncbi:hypothetical protein BJ508DRAFT_313149 [Ascobolus immersus RN42]|uniref:OTU domain-containing protein n=1 Tax=Ascobolus immersus RN42 TaxID=1160509 RepID=A0A3N4HJR1_ASCIM|nr:hypothetical protein BJ508DRAFT_313149 [Ascobolus immersus RN42]